MGWHQAEVDPNCTSTTYQKRGCEQLAGMQGLCNAHLYKAGEARFSRPSDVGRVKCGSVLARLTEFCVSGGCCFISVPLGITSSLACVSVLFPYGLLMS